MKQLLHKILTLTLWACAVPSVVFSETSSKGSSLGSLGSNSLLGESMNNKDFGKLPTHITSDTLTLNSKTRVFVYKGNVVVTQGDMTLTSKEITGNYNEQNQIQKVIATGDVVITKQDIKATSQRATYDAVSSVIVLTDNPQMQQNESVLIADRIKVLLNENRSLAEGNVRVTFVKKEDGSPAQGRNKPAVVGTPAPVIASPAPTGTVAAPPQTEVAADS